MPPPGLELGVRIDAFALPFSILDGSVTTAGSSTIEELDKLFDATDISEDSRLELNLKLESEKVFIM